VPQDSIPGYKAVAPTELFPAVLFPFHRPVPASPLGGSPQTIWRHRSVLRQKARCGCHVSCAGGQWHFCLFYRGLQPSYLRPHPRLFMVGPLWGQTPSPRPLADTNPPRTACVFLAARRVPTDHRTIWRHHSVLRH
jgi:hypothetical protein